MFGISKVNLVIIALLIVIALHVRASFEYSGFAKQNLLTPKPGNSNA
jgi:hypothetical protein